MPTDHKIFKITGRYLLHEPVFIDFCRNSDSDVIAKLDSDIWGEKGKGIHTFAFCAKKYIFLRFGEWLLSNQEFRKHESNPVEWIFYDFLRRENIALKIFDGKMFVETCYTDSNMRITV